MTETEIEIKNKLINYAMENGVDNLSASEIDFIETLDDLPEETHLSPKRVDFMMNIVNKLGII